MANNETYTHQQRPNRRANTPFHPGVHDVQHDINDNDYAFVIEGNLQRHIDTLSDTVQNRLPGTDFTAAEDAISALQTGIGDTKENERDRFVDGLWYCPNNSNVTFVRLLKGILVSFHDPNDVLTKAHTRQAERVGEGMVTFLRQTFDTTKDGRNRKQKLLLMKTFVDVNPFQVLLTTPKGKTNFVVSDVAIFIVKMVASIKTNELAAFKPIACLPNGELATILLNPLELLLGTWRMVKVIVKSMTVRGKRNWLIEHSNGQCGFPALTNLLYDHYIPLSCLAEGRENQSDRLSIANKDLAEEVEEILHILYCRHNCTCG